MNLVWCSCMIIKFIPLQVDDVIDEILNLEEGLDASDNLKAYDQVNNVPPSVSWYVRFEIFFTPSTPQPMSVHLVQDSRLLEIFTPKIIQLLLITLK